MLGLRPQAKPRPALDSQEPSASSPSAKANGAIENVHVGADSRALIVLGGRTLADNETAGLTAILEQTDVKSPLAKGRVKDEELYPLVEFRTRQDTETMLVIRDKFCVEDNEGEAPRTARAGASRLLFFSHAGASPDVGT